MSDLKENLQMFCTNTLCCQKNGGHTFHQDDDNIPHDGEGCAQDKYGEQEGADGVSNLIFWLKEKKKMTQEIKVQYK